MNRSKILGGIALASMMLVVLTGCPGIIQGVQTEESIQEAVDNAASGETIEVQGSHDEDVAVDKDNVTITGDEDATIDGNLTASGDNVTVEDVTVNKDSVVDGNDVTFSNVTVKGDTAVNGDNASIKGSTIEGGLETEPGSFENLEFVDTKIYGRTLNRTIKGPCDYVVDQDETVQSGIDVTSAGDTVCVAPGTYEGGAENVEDANGKKRDGIAVSQNKKNVIRLLQDTKPTVKGSLHSGGTKNIFCGLEFTGTLAVLGGSGGFVDNVFADLTIQTFGFTFSPKQTACYDIVRQGVNASSDESQGNPTTPGPIDADELDRSKNQYKSE